MFVEYFSFFLFNRFLRGGRRRVCLTYLTTPAFKFVSFSAGHRFDNGTPIEEVVSGF